MWCSTKKVRAKGIYVVMSQKNPWYHFGIEAVPYEVRFGQKVRNGLQQLPLSGAVLERLQTKDELVEALQREYNIAADFEILIEPLVIEMLIDKMKSKYTIPTTSGSVEDDSAISTLSVVVQHDMSSPLQKQNAKTRSTMNTMTLLIVVPCVKDVWKGYKNKLNE